MRIFLNFEPEQSPVHRSRLSYAFRVFCAIYGHQPMVDAEDMVSADAVITYSGNRAKLPSPPRLRLSNLFSARSRHLPAPPPTSFESGTERTYLFYGPGGNGNPDWLGEIFEWISCADEYSIKSRDAVGRIPFGDSYVGRHRLDVEVPYAAIAMRLLQQALCKVVSRAPTVPVRPSTAHLIVNTHDVDFLPVSFTNSLGRSAKNAIISLLWCRLPKLALKQAKDAVLFAAGGPNRLDQLFLLAQKEKERSLGATYFVLTQHRHRRDGNYRVDSAEVADQLRFLEQQGMEIGVHGSYNSMDEPSRLAAEFRHLSQQGFHPRGNRQHWLRFTMDTLIPAVERAGALYDTSLGWSECVGFRAGACFAFPPYDLEKERPAKFLEIPLVVMDGSLQNRSNGDAKLYDKVARLLSLSRKYGWGGVSLLWHPTAFGGGQLPEEIGDVFWRLADARIEWNDKWLSAHQFMKSVEERYVATGLLGASS